MWSLLIGLFSNGGLGAITGVVGSLGQKYFEHLDQGQKNSHELAMKQLDIDQMKAEAQSNFQIEQVKSDSAESVAATQAFQASYQLEPQQYADKTKLEGFAQTLMAILDFIRGLVRPAATTYLYVLVTMALFGAIQIMKRDGLKFSSEQCYVLVTSIIETVLNLFTMCSSWYFGQRMSERAKTK